LRGRSEILRHQTGLHSKNEQHENYGDHDLSPLRILHHRDYLLLSTPLGHGRKVTRFKNSRKRNLRRGFSLDVDRGEKVDAINASAEFFR
jgi:hypothetical protein